MSARIPITAIILTKNEVNNISACLQHLAEVDDVVIVDSGSEDGTLERARTARPDVRVFRHEFVDFGEQRNWAIDSTAPRHQWILFVDADEYCDAALLEELQLFMANPGGAVGGYIAGRNYFLGRWLKHSTMFPSYQLRFLKCGEVRFRREGHGQREVTAGQLRYFSHGWRHEGFSKGVHQWVARHNRYSDDEIDLLSSYESSPLGMAQLFARDPIVRRRALKRIAAVLPARPLLRFLYLYFGRLGFLDGRAGLDYCLLCMAHEIHIAVKFREARFLRRKYHDSIVGAAR